MKVTCPTNYQNIVNQMRVHIKGAEEVLIRKMQQRHFFKTSPHYAKVSATASPLLPNRCEVLLTTRPDRHCPSHLCLYVHVPLFRPPHPHVKRRRYFSKIRIPIPPSPLLLCSTLTDGLESSHGDKRRRCNATRRPTRYILRAALSADGSVEGDSTGTRWALEYPRF